MKPADLRRRCTAIFNADEWQTRLARTLAIGPRTVRDYAAGTYSVPGPVVAAIELAETVIRLQGRQALPARWKKEIAE
jgi:hypothetical protein